MRRAFLFSVAPWRDGVTRSSKEEGMKVMWVHKPLASLLGALVGPQLPSVNVSQLSQSPFTAMWASTPFQGWKHPILLKPSNEFEAMEICQRTHRYIPFIDAILVDLFKGSSMTNIRRLLRPGLRGCAG